MDETSQRAPRRDPSELPARGPSRALRALAAFLDGSLAALVGVVLLLGLFGPHPRAGRASDSLELGPLWLQSLEMSTAPDGSPVWRARTNTTAFALLVVACGGAAALRAARRGDRDAASGQSGADSPSIG